MARGLPRPVAWVALTVLVAPLVVGGVVLTSRLLDGDDDPDFGDPGRLNEERHQWTEDDGPLPRLVDATAAWQLEGWRHSAESQIAGGVTVADLDQDGRNDLALAGGELSVFFGTDSGFAPAAGPVPAASREAAAVTAGDLDDDGAVDLVVGMSRGDDVIVWGGRWLRNRDLRQAETDDLPGGDPTTGLAVAELSGDGMPDLLRLGYGPPERASRDVVWEQNERRNFEAVELPNSARRSLAAELADLDGDGLVDIWVTRDIGWQEGGDSVYSRGGQADGSWSDVAEALGADLEIDGMGVTVADLVGDDGLDGYLSDVGENDILAGGAGGFTPVHDTGAARIRAPDAHSAVVSSSWASGATDLNLDGRLDLVVVNGGFDGRAIANKVPDTDVALTDPPSVLLGLGRGRYAEVWPELDLPWDGTSRGMAIGDLDGDGDGDVVIVNHGGGLLAYRNDTAGVAVTVRSDPTCVAAGWIAQARTGKGRIRTLLAAHTFLGAHAPEVSLGSARSIQIVPPGQQPIRLDPDDGSLDVPCR